MALTHLFVLSFDYSTISSGGLTWFHWWTSSVSCFALYKHVSTRLWTCWCFNWLILQSVKESINNFAGLHQLFTSEAVIVWWYMLDNSDILVAQFECGLILKIYQFTIQLNIISSNTSYIVVTTLFILHFCLMQKLALCTHIRIYSIHVHIAFSCQITCQSIVCCFFFF